MLRLTFLLIIFLKLSLQIIKRLSVVFTAICKSLFPLLYNDGKEINVWFKLI